MSKTSSGAGSENSSERPEITQWTRTGLVKGSWSSYDTFEALLFTPNIRAQIQKLALAFLGSEDLFTKAKLSWRRGLFVYGPAGCGKTAASRAIALQLGWQHITIPSHEILDSHLLMRALAQVSTRTPAVVVLENINEVFRHVDPAVFFDIFDQVSERTTGIFWVATTRKPEDVPKEQLVRPGRFEEVLRNTPPTFEVKKLYYETYIEPFLTDIGPAKAEHLALLESNEHLTFAHLHEMRHLIVKVLMDGSDDPEVTPIGKLIHELELYCQEQVIASDRAGGRTQDATALEERIKFSDPRMLLSALQVTDAFKRVIEMTVSATSDEKVAEDLINKS
jgi:SpoVK/Ycf46/Vps4 family AAA+-type ATPase